MIKNAIPLLTLVCLAAFHTGCKTSETGAFLPQKATEYNQEIAAKFVTMDPGAQRSVTCPGIQQKTLEDGRLQLEVQVRNRENRRIEVQINCEFKDERGFTLEATPWQPLILTENSIETVPFTSMNPQAKNYTVRVREAR